MVYAFAGGRELVMRSKLKGACETPDFFAEFAPNRPALETRMLVLASYSENELRPEQAAAVHAHVHKCNACESLLSDLEASAETEVAFAVCPSSNALDAYVFHNAAFSQDEAAGIQKHLQQCPLCREECAWLKDIDSLSPAVLPGRRWMQRLLAVAAVALIALATTLFWRGAQSNADKLRSLAVIKEPSQIDYAQLQRTSNTLQPDDQRIYEDAVTDFQAGRFQSAAPKFEAVLRDTPGHSGATFLLGYSYYRMNQLDRAFELCDHAEAMRPHCFERCMFLVNIALKTGNFQRAFAEISALQHEAPSKPEVQDLYRKISTLMPSGKKI